MLNVISHHNVHSEAIRSSTIGIYVQLDAGFIVYDALVIAISICQKKTFIQSSYKINDKIIDFNIYCYSNVCLILCKTMLDV